MDHEKLKNKAKPMKKRSVQIVHEHFEKALTQLFGFSLFMQWSTGLLLDKNLKLSQHLQHHAIL